MQKEAYWPEYYLKSNTGIKLKDYSTIFKRNITWNEMLFNFMDTVFAVSNNHAREFFQKTI